MKAVWTLATGLCAALLLGASAQAADPYVIGMTASATGPASTAYGPAIEVFRIYFERLNKAGGINGHPVNLVIMDDQGEASRAGANVKRLLQEPGMSMILDLSLSSTYPPVMSEVQRARVPLLFGYSFCPKEVFPPANEWMFCNSGFGTQYDARAAFDFIKETSGTNVKVSLTSLGIPASRAETDFAEDLAKKLGMTPVAKELVPPTAPDYTPFAARLVEPNPDWLYVWGPWLLEGRTIEAVRKLGWKGKIITAFQAETEDELARLKDPDVYAVIVGVPMIANVPEQKVILDVAKQAGLSYPLALLQEPWVGAMTVEAVLRSAGWPVTPEKVKDAMQSLNLDTKGLRGGPLKWTKDNHFRETQSYRIYHWNAEKKAIELVKDWVSYPVK